jgi:hypothetical protein
MDLNPNAENWGIVLMVAPKLFIDLGPKPGFELWSVSDAGL